MNVNVCILGNHDQGALFDPEGFNSGAERAIFWTREQLECPSATRPTMPAAGTFWASCRAIGARTVTCSFTARPEIRSMNMYFPKTSTTSEDGKDLSADRASLLSGTHARARRVYRKA